MTGIQILALRKRMDMTQLEFGRVVLPHSRPESGRAAVARWETQGVTPGPAPMHKLRELDAKSRKGET